MKSEQGHDWLFLAGVGNSGKSHWQRHWQAGHDNCLWLEHRDWEAPLCEEWVDELQGMLQALTRPVVIVAHSLGCLLLLEWATRHRSDKILGAFLVAVPDPASDSFPPEALGFRPADHLDAPFPLTIIASDNDPYGDLAYVGRSAQHLGCSFSNLGALGHINGKSKLGQWPQGFELLQDFRHSLSA
ncbi:RBBP9/YdeN family alpha/beta hydrolase [Pseudomonas carassii]|jgi:hypothetical protein|uniref:Alpha/beta hydrolase n=1 Tax=Pseudomonas carassii TaxID=3115855 RepID=A0ABU7H5R7_9PSED|nr:alpha/beta hydrolase [Pseudomonas sp. 137P]MEE1886604.1 alpha/beta hydrolase [Pseudomonas sp. 137P]